MSRNDEAGENGQDSAPLVRLHRRLLLSRHAVRHAGFRSGRFKPKGQTMVIDVMVPVEISEWNLSEQELAGLIRSRVVEKCGARNTPGEVSVPKRKPGRPRKVYV